MTHTFVSITNRKWQEKKIVEGHSTKPVHQERTTYPPGGLGGHWWRRIDGGLYAELPHFVKYAESQSRSDYYSILLNMQSHSHEATVSPRRSGIAASKILIRNFYASL